MDIKPPSTINRHKNIHNNLESSTSIGSPVVDNERKIKKVKNGNRRQSADGENIKKVNSNKVKTLDGQKTKKVKNGKDQSSDVSQKIKKGGENDKVEQLTGSSEITLYRRRYYILVVFSAIAFMQYCCWNTFGPISTTCMEVFEWSEKEIALMASLDPITYIVTIYLFSWLMDVKGWSIFDLATFLLNFWMGSCLSFKEFCIKGLFSGRITL